MSFSLSGNVSIGNVLQIKGMGIIGFTNAKNFGTANQVNKCRSCNRSLCQQYCSNCGVTNNFELQVEAKSEVYELGPINFQIKIMNYDSGKLILFAGLQSMNKKNYNVCISSNSPQIHRFLKTKPANEWHAIYNHNAVQDTKGWKFDLEVALVTDNVNYLAAAPLWNSVFEDENTADVELIGVDGSVRAHGCIMAAASPFFRAAFYGDFAEARDKRLNVPDANVAALKLIKQYAYTGFVDAQPEVLVTLLPLASRFLMTSLAHACAESLYGLQPEDLIPLLQINLKPTLTEEKEKPQPPQLNNKLEALNNIPENGGAGDSSLVGIWDPLPLGW